MAELTDGTDIREAVRARYAELAMAPAAGEDCRCGTSSSPLGCGNPTAVADLHEGETVLDLGSGGGEDVFISARRVGPTGRVYGLDMTDEMLELAARTAAEEGVANVEWLKGYIEDIPLPDNSVDVVISNCVINLSANKAQVIREAARVLRPGGRFAVTDIVADAGMDDATRNDLRQWTGCIAGAISPDEYAGHLTDAGLADVEVRETHRVHRAAGSAIIRATKPFGQEGVPKTGLSHLTSSSVAAAAPPSPELTISAARGRRGSSRG